MSNRDDLRQAYQLIVNGQTEAALGILIPLCRAEPENPNVWWLLANALTDPPKVEAALQKVLKLKPDHVQARQKLAELRGGELPYVPPPQKTSAKSSSSSGGIWVLGALMLLLVAISGAGAVFILQGEKTPTPPPPPPTRIVSGANAAVLPTQDLPPTWTPAPTVTVVNLPTFTPWWVDVELPTADPALFGETYWEGIGDGYTLDKFTRSGGRHMRFYEFPVKVWVGGVADPLWKDATLHAIEQVSSVVELVLVDNEPDASLVVYVAYPEEYDRLSGCPANQTAGCATILDLGDFGGGDVYHRIYGEVWINVLTRNPYGTVLHEMLHALGLMVHSPYEEDIMYPFENDMTDMTERDLNTLRRLYANPSYAD